MTPSGGNVRARRGSTAAGPVKPRVLSASTLLGESLCDAAGKGLGRIEEFMIDLDAGRVAYAVIARTEPANAGRRLVAVPFSCIDFDRERHEFLLVSNRRLLESAPTFARDEWPDMEDRRWALDLHAHYGCAPYWE